MSTLTIEDLPPEILLDVFEYIPYYDLKTRIPLVSKHFNSILRQKHHTSSSFIDRVLFRDAPQPTSKSPKKKYTLHPALAIFDYLYADSHLITIRNSWHGFESELKNTPLAFENAVSPAVASLVYHPFIPLDEPVTVVGTAKNGGVTLLDLMDAVGDIVRNGKATSKYAGYWWTGVEKVEVDEEGVLHLSDDYHGCDGVSCHHAVNNDPHPKAMTRVWRVKWEEDIIAGTFMQHEELERECGDLLRGTFMEMEI